MRAKLFAAAFAVALLTSCSSVYKGAVTLTKVEAAAMQCWADESKAGRTTPEINNAVLAAHAKFYDACQVAATALEQYKSSGQASDYLKALEAARAAADGVFDLILPLLGPTEAEDLSEALNQARLP